MLCPKCGAEVGETPRFCDACRTTLFRSGRINALRGVGFVCLFGVAIIAGLLFLLLPSQTTTPNLAPPVASSSNSATTAVSQQSTIVPTASPATNTRLSRAIGFLSLDAQKLPIEEAVGSFVRETSSFHFLLKGEADAGQRPVIAELVIGLGEHSLGQCGEHAPSSIKVIDRRASVPTVLFEGSDTLDAVIREYRCAVGTKLQNSLQLQQGVAIASTDSRFELKFDFDGTIELFRNSTAISISTDGLWQLALWDSRTGKIEIGFFDEAPTVETLDIFKQRRTLFDIAKPAADAAPTAVARCGLSFELDGEPTTIAREGIKTLRILLPRTAGEPLYSSSVEEFSLLAANEQAENFTLKAGQLHPGGLIHLQLSDTRIRALEGTQTSYSWKFDVSAPILAIYEDTVPLTELHRRLGKLSAELPPLPKGQAPIGTISVGKASAVIVDAVALSFPEDERVTIGLYAERLSDEQRRRIIANRSVWNLDKEVMARAVVSLSTKSKLDSASRLEFTVVRDFLGTFYFDGLRDRLTFSFSDRQLYPSNLRFFHRGTASNVLAMRVRDSQTSTEGQVLFWDLHIEADIN